MYAVDKIEIKEADFGHVDGDLGVVVTFKPLMMGEKPAKAFFNLYQDDRGNFAMKLLDETINGNYEKNGINIDSTHFVPYFSDDNLNFFLSSDGYEGDSRLNSSFVDKLIEYDFDKLAKSLNSKENVKFVNILEGYFNYDENIDYLRSTAQNVDMAEEEFIKEGNSIFCHISIQKIWLGIQACFIKKNGFFALKRKLIYIILIQNLLICLMV